MNKRPASIKDVSRHAGVSTATVSRAFSDPERLSEKALKKVHASAKALNYRPNFLAKTFRSRRSDTILVMVPDLGNGFFTRVLSGIEKVIRDAGYSLLVIDTQDDLNRERDGVGMIISRRVDGIIQLGKTPIESLLAEEDNSLVPFVHSIEATDETNAPNVTLDNVSASADITRHLIKLGHTRFGLIGGPEDSHITRDRKEGTFLVFDEYNIPHSDSQIVYSSFNMSSGQLAAEELLRKHTDITALICMSDDLAIGAIKHIKSLGKSVPDDISVVGFDDVAYSEFFDPPLTTVVQPADVLGSESANMLLDRITQSNDVPLRKVLKAKIVIRDSCGPIAT